MGLSGVCESSFNGEYAGFAAPLMLGRDVEGGALVMRSGIDLIGDVVFRGDTPIGLLVGGRRGRAEVAEELLLEMADLEVLEEGVGP